MRATASHWRDIPWCGGRARENREQKVIRALCFDLSLGLARAFPRVSARSRFPVRMRATASHWRDIPWCGGRARENREQKVIRALCFDLSLGLARAVPRVSARSRYHALARNTAQGTAVRATWVARTTSPYIVFTRDLGQYWVGYPGIFQQVWTTSLGETASEPYGEALGTPSELPLLSRFWEFECPSRISPSSAILVPGENTSNPYEETF